MLNYLCKYLLNKDIVLYHLHRQTIPIIHNLENKKKYVFINIIYFWRIFPIPGKYKLKFKVMYLILNIVNPKYIIDINWTSKWNSLYKIWTKKHQTSKYVVMQHGSYVAGIVNDKKHRYTKCDIFLTWSDYFTRLFENYNEGKKTKMITFGNPIFNKVQRDEHSYVNKNNGKILIVPSAISEERLFLYNDLFIKLKDLGFDVFVKEHNAQGKKKKMDGIEVYFPQIKNVHKIEGDLENIIRGINDYDLIISDHSTALIDAIYFRNKVVYFSSENNDGGYTPNQYSKYLKNLFCVYKEFKNKADLYDFVSVEAQEELLVSMITKGDNVLNNYLLGL